MSYTWNVIHVPDKTLTLVWLTLLQGKGIKTCLSQ